ncbi:hypothetical protein [Arthrobacter sp. 18067]|uniref:hypothetical protein n=1 Tax=Arthrobacter sp. 18067 TaxID=2681413 RepID=UPI0013593CA6|nr:hypothetical protein [Arthrobacter sp. 18067]
MTTTEQPFILPDHIDPAELAGLSKAVGTALAKHPQWMRDNDGRVICAGRGCTWEKPEGKSIQDRWIRHQTFAVSSAVRTWYVDGILPEQTNLDEIAAPGVYAIARKSVSALAPITSVAYPHTDPSTGIQTLAEFDLDGKLLRTFKKAPDAGAQWTEVAATC